MPAIAIAKVETFWIFLAADIVVWKLMATTEISNLKCSKLTESKQFLSFLKCTGVNSFVNVVISKQVRDLRHLKY